MKIAHLSDLHLNTYFRHSNLPQIQFLLEYALKQGFDHLIISGDLTDNADQDDFKILRDLFNSYGLLDTSRLSLVIGNHDIFGGIIKAEDIISFPEKCRQTDYELKLHQFSGYFKETFENCVYNSANIFPYAKFINGVLIIGTNTIAEYSKLKNPFASNGRIDEMQYNELNEILGQYGSVADTIIVITHHHFNKMKKSTEVSSSGIMHNIEKQTMKLRKKKKLLNLFFNHSVDIVLHGHVHEMKEYIRGGIKFLNAGASVKGDQGNMLGINFIETGAGITRITKNSILFKEDENTRYSDNYLLSVGAN